MADVTPFINGNGDITDSLIVVFLRGGADGLNLVAPLGDDGYFNARPFLQMKREDAVKLDDFYALNPLLEDLEPLYREGEMAVIHAVGSEDSTRSHFEAQDLMEHGGEFVAGGWLGRFLRTLPNGANGPLSAVAIANAMPEVLRGAPASIVMESLNSFSLGKDANKLTGALGRLYSQDGGPLGTAARDTLGAIRRIEKLRTEKYTPNDNVRYDNRRFGQGMQQIARLIKARVGLVSATIDLGGWDSHQAQNNSMNPLISQLGKGLSDLCRDLGSLMKKTTVVVMTEFGRRVYENSSFGTDHGRGSVMFALGGDVKGGQVIANWKELKRENLEGPGDLPVTTNYRDVLTPILSRFGVAEKMRQVFPEFELAPVSGLVG